MNNRIVIEDSTLREGEQTPGVAFTEKQKHQIVQALVGAGIRYIEVGTPAMGSLEYRTIQSLAAEATGATLIGWNRGVKEDLEKTVQSGLRALHVGLPSSKVHIENKFKRDESWVIETAQSLVEYAKSQGVTFISISAEDMGRADMTFLKRYAKALKDAGATRMRLSDTVGCLVPTRVAAIVSELRASVGIDLQLHMHNDFNLALANVMAGVEAGASQVHVTVNGLGERAGLAAMHQVAAALEILMKKETGIVLKRLGALSDLVAELSGLPIAHNEPILGRHVFTHESGIHVDGMLKVKESFEAFPPELVGRSHEFVIGKHSGSHALVHILGSRGVAIDGDAAKELLPIIREIAPMLGGTVTPELAGVLATALAKRESRQA